MLALLNLFWGFKEPTFIKVYSTREICNLLPFNEELSYPFNNYAIDSNAEHLYFLTKDKKLYKVGLINGKVINQRDVSSDIQNSEFSGIISGKNGPLIICYSMREKDKVKIIEYTTCLEKLNTSLLFKADSEDITMDYLRFPYLNNGALIGDYRNRIVYGLDNKNSFILRNTIVDPFSNNEYTYDVDFDYIHIKRNGDKKVFFNKEFKRNSYYNTILFIANKQFYIIKKDSSKSMIGQVDFSGNKITTLFKGDFLKDKKTLEIRPFYNGIYWQTSDSLYIVSL